MATVIQAYPTTVCHYEQNIPIRIRHTQNTNVGMFQLCPTVILRNQQIIYRQENIS